MGHNASGDSATLIPLLHLSGTDGGAEPSAGFAPPGSVCRACLHGLRGLSVLASCSECNAPVISGLDASWWGNAPIGYPQDLARHARRAAAAATLIPIIYLVSLLVAPATATTMAQSSLACWGVVLTQVLTAVAFAMPYLTPRGGMTLMMWSSMAYLIASPLSILLAARAFVVLSRHIGGTWLKRLGIAHGVVGVTMLLVTLPLIAVYASFLSGSFTPGAWWISMLAWLPSLIGWLTILPVVILPVMVWVFGAALARLIEARRAGM